MGQSLIGVFVAELLGAQHGIGAMIENAGQQFQTATVFAGLVIFATAGMLLTAWFAGWSATSMRGACDRSSRKARGDHEQRIYAPLPRACARGFADLGAMPQAQAAAGS